MSWEKRKLHIDDNWFCLICNCSNKVYDKKKRLKIIQCKECNTPIHKNIKINKEE